MTYKFSPGDRVFCLSDRRDGNLDVVGQYGTVICYNVFDRVGVEFDEEFRGGHRLDRHLDPGSMRGWYLYEDDLELAGTADPTAEFEIAPTDQLRDLLTRQEVTP